MTDYNKFDKRVQIIEGDVKAILKEMAENKAEAMENRRVDREILVELKTIVKEHLTKHSGIIGNLKYIGTAVIALIALIKGFLP